MTTHSGSHPCNNMTELLLLLLLQMTITSTRLLHSSTFYLGMHLILTEVFGTCSWFTCQIFIFVLTCKDCHFCQQRAADGKGDVGCEKTIVAFLVCMGMEVISSGFQFALMVPTEVLAVQHYKHLTSLLDKFDGDEKPNIALITGSTSARESRIIQNYSIAGS